MTHIRRLAKFIADFDLANASSSVTKAAKCCVLDALGVAVGASISPQIKNMIERSNIDGTFDRGVSLWGLPERVTPTMAAFFNAMMSHFLELDDVHSSSKTHIGTTVVPAAWALGEYLGATGKELLGGVVCGYEVTSRIGMGIGVTSHRGRGWHVTGTAGTFGAAAACAKILKLDEDRIVYALGMAGTQSSGLWSFLEDGASCKILHPAAAARNGMTAALLASAGMSGAEHVLDASDGGMFAAMSDEYDLALVSEGLGQTYEILNVENKPYPCCRSSHCAIDAAFAVSAKSRCSVEEITQIDIATYFVGYKQCASTPKSQNPTNTVEAKFSTPYAVACAFLYNGVSEEYFSKQYIDLVKKTGLIERINVFPDERFTADYPRHWGCEMTVHYKNGEEMVVCVRDPLGSKENPVNEDHIRKKALSMFRDAFGERADAIVDQVLTLETRESLPSVSAQCSLSTV